MSRQWRLIRRGGRVGEAAEVELVIAGSRAKEAPSAEPVGKDEVAVVPILLYVREAV